MNKKEPVPSPYGKLEQLYTFDQMKEVWYFSMIQGASLWQYSIDKKRNLPQDFDKGLDGIRNTLTDPKALQFLLGASVVLFGLYDEMIDNGQPNNSMTLSKKKRDNQKPPNSKSVK